MVHPVLQDKIIRDIKKYCSHISGLSMRLVLTAGPDGICAFLPHQSFGLNKTLNTIRFIGMQVLPFMPSLEFYPRNSLRMVPCLSLFKLLC